MAERNVSVKLSANVAAYQAAMGRAQASTEGFSSGSQKSLNKLGGMMQQVGGAATKGITVPLVAAAGVAVKLSADFDTAFSRMVGLAGVAADEVDGLKESVLNLAGRTAVAPQELADALYFLRSSGLGASDAMDALELSAQASAAGLGSTATIADAVSSAMNAYAKAGLSAAEATDILVATARAGKAEPEELAGALGRVLPIASELGVTFEDVGGAIASLSLSGNDASTSATLLSNILSKMLKPSQQGADALKAVGLSTDSIRASIADKGLLVTLEDLKARLGDAGFVKFMEDAQAVQGALALTGQNADTVHTAFDQVADSAGSTGAAFDAVASGPGFRMKQAWVDIQVALIQAGDVIMPIVAGIADVASQMAKSFSGLPGPAKAIVLAFLALAAAAGPLLIVGGSMVRNLKEIKSGFTALKTGAPAMGAAMGAATLVTIAFALNAKQAADNARGLADSLDAVARASDADRLDAFALALAQAKLNGKDLPALLDEMTQGNIGLTETLIDQVEANGIAGRSAAEVATILDELYAARNREIIAISEQADAQKITNTVTDEATASMDANVDATTTMAGALDYLDERRQTAAHSVASLAAAEEIATDKAEAHAKAMVEQAEGYVESAAAAWTWMGNLTGAMDSAGGAISTFSDDALNDIDTFQKELEDNIIALYGWQNNLITIAAETTPEFATYLADMGVAGAGLVEDLANNIPELETTFAQWQMATAVASRDMVAEFAKVSPETLAEFEKLGHQVASTIEGMGPLTAAEAQAVGAAIAAGIALGVDINAGFIAASVTNATHLAIARAKEAIEAGSPSRLFAREVGAPIAWGIAAGMDENQQKVIDSAQHLVEALEKGIDSAKKDALDAVDDMVDEVADRFDGIWDAIAGRRDLEGLTENVADAETNLAAVLADGESTSEDVVAARERLEDANYRLLKASQDLLDQGPAGQAAFIALAQAAGLEAGEIRNLILAYTDLQMARATAIGQQAAINAEVASSQDIRARFGQAAASGLANDWIGHIAQFANDPAFQLELMSAFLATLPSFAGGGIVPGVGPQLVIAHGGEPIGAGYANMTSAGDSYGATTTAVFNVTVNAGMGADGREIGDVILEKLAATVRRNGPGVLVKLTGG